MQTKGLFTPTAGTNPAPHPDFLADWERELLGYIPARHWDETYRDICRDAEDSTVFFMTTYASEHLPAPYPAFAKHLDRLR